MEQTLQWIVVGIIVAAAALYLVRKLSRPRGSCTHCNCSGCRQDAAACDSRCQEDSGHQITKPPNLA